ncbi:MAG: carbohydrate porin [Cyanobacteriota bacterium]
MGLKSSALAALLSLATTAPALAIEAGTATPAGTEPTLAPERLAAVPGNSAAASGDTPATESRKEATDLMASGAPGPAAGGHGPQPTDPSRCHKSHAVNLAVTKALKRPPTNNPLDSFTYIAGIRCQEQGLLKQDFLLQSGSLTENLQNKGVEFTFTYYPDVSWSNFTQPGFSAMYIASMDVYTGKTGVLWKGGQIHFTTAGWMGDNYTGSTAINHSIRAEDPPYAGNAWRIFELWYGQKLSNNVELRLGKIYPWVKIASHQTSGIFQNTAFDYPGVYGSTETTGNFLPYPVAPLGAQLIINPDPHNQFIFHVMDGKDDPSGGYNYTLGETSLNANDGVEFIAEYAYLDHSPDPSKLPGYYKIGFQGNTGRFYNFSSKTMSNGSYGGYATLEKMLYAEPGAAIPRSQGLLGFLKANVTPSPTNIVGFNFSAGLTYAGLIPGRDRDMAGIGVAYSSFNADAANYYATTGAYKQGLVPSGSETILEAVYLAQLTPWLMLIGSYQYIFSPSKYGATDPLTPTGHVVMLNTRLAF